MYHARMYGGGSLGSAHFSELGLRCAFYALMRSDWSIACANDARQAALVEPLPYGLNHGHRPVSPDGYWVRLG
jgi:hypothetical protein